MEYWLGVLQAQIPTVMEKAIASEDHSKGTPLAAQINARQRCTHSTTEKRLRVFPVHHHSPEHFVMAAQCHVTRWYARCAKLGNGIHTSVRNTFVHCPVVAHAYL